MPTYRTTARNQFRSPSGAVGEAPDGPGALATLADDVDLYLGVGGAEYCANRTAVAAIPAARKFPGKLAYAADSGITFRYVGAGNLPIQLLAGQNMLPQWMAWHKAPMTFVPAFTQGLTWTSPTIQALYGISDGLLWFDMFITSATAATLSSTLDVAMTSPLQMVSGFGEGGGTWTGGGGTTALNNQHDLYAYATGAPSGGASTTLRVRARVASAAGASVKQNQGLGAYITPAANDWFSLHFRGVSADGV